MKSLFKIGALIVISLILIQPAHAQKLLNRIKNKAKQKVEQRVEKRVEKKVDDKIDEGLDKIEDSLEKNKEGEESDSSSSANTESKDEKNQRRVLGIMKGMGISSTPVPIADNYKFDDLIQMHIESYDKSGAKVGDGEFITHFDPNSKSMAYEVLSGDIGKPGQGLFIIDTENGATIILSEENGEKSGIVYGMGAYMETMGETYQQEDLEETPETYLANPNVKKTGKTKTIAGYKCEEYIYSDKETKSDVWITKNLKMNTQDLFSSLFKVSIYSHGMGWGFMMETTSEDLVTGEKSLMKVTKVETNANTKFAMSDYKITNLGSFQPPVKE